MKTFESDGERVYVLRDEACWVKKLWCLCCIETCGVNTRWREILQVLSPLAPCTNRVATSGANLGQVQTTQHRQTQHASVEDVI